MSLLSGIFSLLLGRGRELPGAFSLEGFVRVVLSWLLKHSFAQVRGASVTMRVLLRTLSGRPADHPAAAAAVAASKHRGGWCHCCTACLPRQSPRLLSMGLLRCSPMVSVW